jgi:hypothetical protein
VWGKIAGKQTCKTLQNRTVEGPNPLEFVIKMLAQKILANGTTV